MDGGAIGNEGGGGGERPLTTAPAGDTKRRILDATLDTLKRDGFAATSARAIARAGGFNQALIFYHYGSLADLLLAALDDTSWGRLARYREELAGVRDLTTAVRTAAALYAEDVRSGHIKVLAELIAGASSLPGLGPEIVVIMQPWITFTEESIRRLVAGTPLEEAVPAREAAYALVALYLGVELLTHLDGDETRAEALFRAGADIAGLVDALAGAMFTTETEEET